MAATAQSKKINKSDGPDGSIADLVDNVLRVLGDDLQGTCGLVFGLLNHIESVHSKGINGLEVEDPTTNATRVTKHNDQFKEVEVVMIRDLKDFIGKIQSNQAKKKTISASAVLKLREVIKGLEHPVAASKAPSWANIVSSEQDDESKQWFPKQQPQKQQHPKKSYAGQITNRPIAEVARSPRYGGLCVVRIGKKTFNGSGVIAFNGPNKRTAACYWKRCKLGDECSFYHDPVQGAGDHGHERVITPDRVYDLMVLIANNTGRKDIEICDMIQMCGIVIQYVSDIRGC